MPSDDFNAVTAKLDDFLSGKSFKLQTSEATEFSQDLGTLIGLLLDQTLSLSDASVTTASGSAAAWTLSGTADDWPFPALAVLAGAPVSLVVTDGSPLTFNILSDATVGGAPIAISFALDPTQTLPSARLTFTPSSAISIGQAVQALTLPGLIDAVTVADDLLALADAAFVDGSLLVQHDKSQPGPTTAGGEIVGVLTLGSFATQVAIDLPSESSTLPSISLAWPAPGQTATGALSGLLAALHLPFSLPDALDVAVTSLAIDYQHIAAADQLNPNDSLRVALRSPNDTATPSLAIVWSRGDPDKTWRMVVRAGWNLVDLSNLPVVGSHLPAQIDPMLLVVLTHTLPLADLKVLAGLASYPGLEEWGMEPDKVTEQTPIAAGIYCAAIFDVTIDGKNFVNAAAAIPLYLLDPQQKSSRLAAAPAPDLLAEASVTVTRPVQKSIGPVHLDSVGFRYEAGIISILVSVSIETGGLGLELVGLALGYDVKTHDLALSIDGLLLSFDEGGVDIGGALVREPSSGGNDWAGAAIVKIGDAFALAALGAFSEGDPKSMFLFAYDHQQLGGPPWLIITGIAAGFGYNRSFIVPDVSEVDDFPFVAIANDLSRGEAPNGGEPIDTNALWRLMDSIKTSLGPADGSDFLTVGLTATSFGLVNTTALLTIVFGRSTEFVILGSSSISVPADAPVAHAEVELVASIQPQAGIIAIDGLLAPGSYVLSQACHLTGGFAYHLWFAGIHAGDFVMTFGGYAPHYDKPSHYPDVPRLAFVWSVSDELTVTGWNYFALTPSSVQAGGGLSITLDADPLYVFCNAQADFFLGWMPFFYSIEASFDFGVSFRLHVVFCTIHISVDISADLHIWGPDFSGHAHVDLWFVSFGVDFGAGASQTPRSIGWDEFVGSLVVPGASDDAHAAMLAHDAPRGRLHASAASQQPVQITAVAGLTKSAVAGIDLTGDPARTVLSVVTTMPASTVTLNGTEVVTGSSIVLHARPLDNSPEISPTLTVTITAASGDADDLIPWTPTAVVEQVASAVWGTTSSGELIPAITGLRLTVTQEKPDTLGPVEQSVLLVNTDAPAIPAAWRTPVIPAQQSYDWDTQGPFATMHADTIRAQLAGLVQAGILAQAALDAIDLTFVKPTEACFMAYPTLAQLGAEKYAEAA